MAAERASENATKQDIQAHERDYAGFTRLFLWGAVASFTIGIIVLFIIA